MLKLMQVVLAAVLGAATLASCDDRNSQASTTPTATEAAGRPGANLVVDAPHTSVYRDSVGAASYVRNTGLHGVRDIELSIKFFAGDQLVLTTPDTLAFCPGEATCPWATSFGITEAAQRTIDSAHVDITSTGPPYDDGIMRTLDLRRTAGAVSFDLPPRPGVVILYVVENDAPNFGFFMTHQFAEQATIRHTEDLLPIGPGTRGVFYEGHIPADRRAGGD